ncbi:glycerate kinase [Streptomyces sp. CA-106110]|uniref:glycerate kinase n=1 Tax=Streptomyces sp. CA-106110 TaxID=3240044 RepID=UPI003D8AD3C0
MSSPHSPTVVVAPDKFRGSLTASQAASAIAAGVHDVVPSARIIEAPVADGGEGTVEILAAHGATRVPVQVAGSLGETVEATLCCSEGVCFVEVAEICGLALLTPTPRTALDASSYGVGQAIRTAIVLGAREVVVCLGGSATTDGGYGMANALGFTVLDSEGRVLSADTSSMHRAWDIHPSRSTALLNGVKFTAATDVQSPLLGTTGAVATYAPQKGADEDAMGVLERRLSAWSDALRRSSGRDIGSAEGAGAAGGIGAALVALLNAQVTSGASLVIDTLELQSKIQTADLVITGEGSLDEQSLNGKLPLRIAEIAHANAVPVFAVSGRTEIDPTGIFDKVGQVMSDLRPGEDPFVDAEAVLRRLTARLVSESVLVMP